MNRHVTAAERIAAQAAKKQKLPSRNGQADGTNKEKAPKKSQSAQLWSWRRP